MVLRSGVALFAALGVTLAGCSSTPAPEGTEPLNAAEELVEPLDREQTDAEKDFEHRAEEGELDIASGTARLLRDDDVALYWVSRSANGEICFSTELTPEPAEELGTEVDEVTSYSCASEAGFSDEGIAGKLSSVDGALVRAHLLPNDVSEESAKAVQKVLDTEATEEPRETYPYLLVTTDSTGLKEEDVTVERSSGGDIPFWMP